jgi:hypothetical protein
MMRLRLFIGFIIFASISFLHAGPNSNAGMAIDFVPETPAIDSVSAFLSAATITLSVKISGAVNLDAYMFDIRFDTTVLKFKSAMEDNPFASLDNILKKNSGSTVGFICTPKPGTSGVLNIANTLVGEDSAQAPEGSGILAVLMFTIIKEQTCTLFIEKGFPVDYEQIKDSVKTYTHGVVKPASTGVFPVVLPRAQHAAGSPAIGSGFTNRCIFNVLGRRISGEIPANRLLFIQGKKPMLKIEN